MTPREEAIEAEVREACVLRDAFATWGGDCLLCDLRPRQFLCELGKKGIEVEAREACVMRDAFAIGRNNTV